MTPAERELEQIALDCPFLVPRSLLLAVLAWHRRWSGRPSREAIQGVLSLNGVMTYASMPADAISRQSHEARRSKLVDDLISLLSGEEARPKEWCQHMELKMSNVAGKERWFFSDRKIPYPQAIADDWKVCPLCSAPRPGKE